MIDMSASGALSGFRNRIINGDMRVAQRGAIALSASVQYGSCDRWRFGIPTGSAFAGNMVQLTGLSTTSSGYGFGGTALTWTTGIFQFDQRIEAMNCGGLNGKTVTISGKIIHTIGSTRTVYVNLYKANAVDNFGAVTQIGSNSTISVPNNTLVPFSVSYTLGATDANTGLQLSIIDSVATSASAITIYIGDIQLEVGSVATPFEQRPIGTELALCQRYYFKSQDIGNTPGTATGSPVTGVGNSVNNCIVSGFRYPVQMRNTPTVTFTSFNGTTGVWSTSATNADTAATTINGSAASGFQQVLVTGTTTGAPYYAYVSATAEL
jgi:hypothetical protein